MIARHSLTGLNIIIFHDGLFNISYCVIINRKNWRIPINIVLKSQHFFKKSERTDMLGPSPSSCSFLFAFQCPLPSSTNVLSEWPHMIREHFITEFLKVNESQSFPPCKICWRNIEKRLLLIKAFSRAKSIEKTLHIDSGIWRDWYTLKTSIGIKY